ncbi:hypothetical protein [Bradyrhizobium betae]|uniref:Tetratricopeptide repeat protein n=1 Tax=Bradyrhizobium betae TaxID=244734 RepID=A0A5P6PBR2_9BRAD|nr:hypothetical protein [Bradyrhizobium betae]MCS3726469.1 hypothetical protein [Bradyrhizobium betae]QFI75528.1 hypothetical protein F8237_25915 [Bradyrhizobium betae]
MNSASEKFISLIFDKRLDEARALLRAHRGALTGDELPRLFGVEEALRAKIGQLGPGPSEQRRTLAGAYTAAHWLREQNYWDEAQAIYLDVVKRSLEMNEAFFLNDARLSRAVCLKNLGRMNEYELAKAEVPPGTTCLIDWVIWRVEDL